MEQEDQGKTEGNKPEVKENLFQREITETFPKPNRQNLFLGEVPTEGIIGVESETGVPKLNGLRHLGFIGVNPENEAIILVQKEVEEAFKPENMGNILNMDFYQSLCETTANRDYGSKKIRLRGNPQDLRLDNFALGLAGESGEVLEMVKKYLYHGHELDMNKLIKELGDVFWYLATIASTFNIPLSEIAGKNIAKLKERYPDGFSAEKSINRKAEE
jgi:NTP pyrophosphatase (non-canonical NTP hydrolase)